MDTIRYQFEIPELAKPVDCEARYESPDYSVGLNGGCFLEEARIDLANDVHGKPRVWKLDRDDFEAVFGSQMLQAVEEFAYDCYMDRRYEDMDRTEEVEA